MVCCIEAVRNGGIFVAMRKEGFRAAGPGKGQESLVQQEDDVEPGTGEGRYHPLIPGCSPAQVFSEQLHKSLRNRP